MKLHTRLFSCEDVVELEKKQFARNSLNLDAYLLSRKTKGGISNLFVTVRVIIFLKYT